jgi:hypothetical protein
MGIFFKRMSKALPATQNKFREAMMSTMKDKAAMDEMVAEFNATFEGCSGGSQVLNLDQFK